MAQKEALEELYPEFYGDVNLKEGIDNHEPLAGGEAQQEEQVEQDESEKID